LKPREISPPARKGFSVLATPLVNGCEIAAWGRQWNERSAHLLELVAGIDHGSLEPAAELLQELRECRRRLADPPHPELRSLWHRALDEIWEAARSTLYGDLGPARQHADAALHHGQVMRRILEAQADWPTEGKGLS
jgi:hypothetical protein